MPEHHHQTLISHLGMTAIIALKTYDVISQIVLASIAAVLPPAVCLHVAVGRLGRKLTLYQRNPNMRGRTAPGDLRLACRAQLQTRPAGRANELLLGQGPRPVRQRPLLVS